MAIEALSPGRSISTVLDYHERSQLQPDDTPPSGKVATKTVRHGGILRVPLSRRPLDEDSGPELDALFTHAVATRPVGQDQLGDFVYDALALSARQQGPGGWRRRLRIVPSFGGAAAIQAHLVVGPDAGLDALAAVYHYTALAHALERRRVLLDGDWASIAEPLPAGAFIVGLSTIPSRLAPMSGVRAPRDADLEIGHAITAIAVSAAIRGWQARIVDTVADHHQARWFGLDRRLGQRPAVLMAVFPGLGMVGPPMLDLPTDFLDRLASDDAEGQTNLRPIPDAEAGLTAATTYFGQSQGSLEVEPPMTAEHPEIERDVASRTIVHQRRHAHAFDPDVRISRTLFLHFLRRLTPDASTVPWSILPWRARTAALLFVHRVEGFAPGLYLLGRHADHLPSIRSVSNRDGLAWQPVEADGLELLLLREAEVNESAELVCCHQTTAGDGAFTAVLLAEMEPALHWHGPWFYPRLFWEAGAVGQWLALEAEAADLSAAFLGRFHDPLVHLLLGLDSPTWRALYAIAVGARIDDPRIVTTAPYRDGFSR
ncbi:MAG: hypothetical protein AAGE94_13010 [Acidobacteriota bacterium]